MNQGILTSMKQILSQKGLPKEVLVEAIEAALLSAAKRRFGSIQSVKVELNELSGEIEVFAPKRVVEIMKSFATEIPIEEAAKLKPDAQIGDILEVPIETKDFGRIEAQQARQTLIDMIRDAERRNIYNLYKDRIEDIVTGIIQQQEYRDVMVEIEGAEAVLPGHEQIRTEAYRRGDRIRALIMHVVDPDNREEGERRYRAPVVLSRVHPALVARLFEQEVPEIADGLVTIQSIAREAGERSKIAVAAMEEGIDPVGTCVGVRGSRIQMVVRELNGERIDVIPWNPNPAEFIARSLSPARVTEVILEEDEHGEGVAKVVVPEDQLSLAIGKKGQNVRLAHRLTGWKIDIISDKEAGAELRSRVEAEIFKETAPSAESDEETPEIEATPIESLVGVSPKLANMLRERGFGTLTAIANASVEQLAELPNLGAKTAQKLIDSARSVLEHPEG